MDITIQFVTVQSMFSVYTFLSHRGVARIFQRGAHTVSNIIVKAFSPRNIIGCFLKKELQRGSRFPLYKAQLENPLVHCSLIASGLNT